MLALAGAGSDAAREPGRLRSAGIALAALALTGFFMVLGFPYDRLAQRIAQHFERESGTRVALGEVSLGFVRWAPGLEAEGVQIVQTDGSRLDLDHVGVRPALSLSWLRGDPALAMDVASPHGGGSGVVTFGERSAFDGSLEALDLAWLPQDRLGAPLRLEGHADADVDLVFGPEGPVGSVAFEAHEGVVSHPELPLPLPFQTLSGEIELGGEELARIRTLDLASPLASGHARGSIGRSTSFATAPLRLQLELEVSGAIRSSLNAQGVEVGNQGQLRIDVTGTPARPVVR